MLFVELSDLGESERIEVINEIKLELHNKSPFVNEPTDCVLWISDDRVVANDYNPNKVAPPEQRLLAQSISKDGFTQPIVTFAHDGIYEVVDGFHRNLVGKQNKAIRKRILHHLPVTVINSAQSSKADRIASTIRHNRARGRHQVEEMSKIVLELVRRNWNEQKIGKELGMEPDEVLRLKQITGLAEMFADTEFTKAWEIQDSIETVNEPNIDLDV